MIAECKDCKAPKTSKTKPYCKKCGYKHRTRPFGLKYNIKSVNKGWFKKGFIPWSTGKERKDLLKVNPGYEAIHEWVERWAGLAKEKPCEGCNSTKNIDWSNISGEYKRNLSDWQRLCKKCHGRYDYEKFGAREVFYK